MLPEDKKTFIQSVKALRERGVNTPRKAKSATRAMLYLWQKRDFPRLVKDESAGINKYLRDSLIRSHAEWIGNQSFLDGAFWLSTTYALLIGKELQSHFAMYFTPPMLANRLIDNLVSNGASLTEHRWKDPACGGGAFLLPVSIRMIEELRKKGASPKAIIEKLSSNLAGADIDPLLSMLSTSFIKMAAYREIIDSRCDLELQISVANSLSVAETSHSVEVVICNPPYRKMSRQEWLPYQDHFGEVITGQPNIYGLFIQKCIELATQSGLIGLLTPTSYLSGQNFSKLRRSIRTFTSVQQLDLIVEKEGIFLGVEQEAVLSVLLRGEQNTSNATEIFTLSKSIFKRVGSCTLPNGFSAWPIPRDNTDTHTLIGAGKSPYRLRDYGYIVRTGAYVDYRDCRTTYMTYPTKAITKAVFPLIWSADITTKKQLDHGRTSKRDSRPTFIEMNNPTHQSVIRRPCLALQRVTSAEQARRLVGAEVPRKLLLEFGGVVGENHVLFLEWINEKVGISPSLMVDLLSSYSVDRLFRCISGAVNVSIFELEQLPLPDPSILSKLLSNGKNTVDAAVEQAYLTTSHLNVS